MNSSDAAEAVVKMSLETGEVALRIVGTGAEKLAVLLYTMAKDKKMSKGKTTLNNMLRSGSPLQIFSLKENELKKFQEETKKYGVLYTALIDKKHPDTDGLVDIMVRQEDAVRVNHIVDRIIERFKLSAVDMAEIKTEVEKDKMDEMLQDAKDRGVEIKSDEEKLVDDIMSKPIQKEENEISNPNVAKTEKSPLSEPLLENKNESGVATNPKKPSVRSALKKIKEELKSRNAPKEYREDLQNDKDIDVEKKKTTTLKNENTSISNKNIKNKGKER